jgi:hypothetical protein
MVRVGCCDKSISCNGVLENRQCLTGEVGDHVLKCSGESDGLKMVHSEPCE